MDAHFTFKEITRHNSQSEINEIKSDANLFCNIVSLVSILNVVRDNLGLPITINSLYRNVEHNKKVGGVPSSQHITGSAVDITCSNLQALRDELVKFQANKPYIGQLIIYKNFIHLGLAKPYGDKERPFIILYSEK